MTGVQTCALPIFATGAHTVWGHAYRSGTGMSFGGHDLMQAQTFGAFHGGSDYFGLGIVAHESGHALFDLPDLYDTVATDGIIHGFGHFSLMSAGSWGSTPSSPKQGSCPVNLDGFCIHYISKALCKEINASGAQTLASPYEPHFIVTPKVKDEVYILQPRCFQDYDEALQNYLGAGAKNGVLVIHKNPWFASVSSPTVMCAHIIEAHGGEQHLRVNDGGNAGQDTDFFGNGVNALLTQIGRASCRERV